MSPGRLLLAAAVLAASLVLTASGCRGQRAASPPAVTFVTIPAAGPGGSDALAPIAGRVTGAAPGDRIVLFARSGVWWVQPWTAQPFTSIGADGAWSSTIHLGAEYAALLVTPEYRPPATLEAIPPVGGAVRAAVTTRGAGDFVARTPAVISFSGYDWEVRRTPSDRGGPNDYDTDNAWIDGDGFLHLKLAQRGGRWTSAEITLTRPLGYGSYAIVVRDTSHLDPAAAFGFFTWDDENVDQNHRELDIEISRWGDPQIANAQYVVQPYYVAANVRRFVAPAGRLTHAFRWEPGKASFHTTRGAGGGPAAPLVAAHEFTAGVPSPGNERVRMNLYFFRYSPTALQKEVEVVVEKFTYLP
jgi:hypothetical protein